MYVCMCSCVQMKAHMYYVEVKVLDFHLAWDSLLLFVSGYTSPDSLGTSRDSPVSGSHLDIGVLILQICTTASGFMFVLEIWTQAIMLLPFPLLLTAFLINAYVLNTQVGTERDWETFLPSRNVVILFGREESHAYDSVDALDHNSPMPKHTIQVSQLKWMMSVRKSENFWWEVALK